MMVSLEYPPNIKEIRKVIDLSKFPNAVFTYGHTIHNPSDNPIDEPLQLHEAQHSLQQDQVGGPKKWWKRWLSEPTFRLEQEIEAYGMQWRRFCELHTDRNRRALFLHRVASDLSSEQYGKVISLVEARNRIRKYHHDF